MRGSLLLTVRFNENQRSKIGITSVSVGVTWTYIYIYMRWVQVTPVCVLKILSILKKKKKDLMVKKIALNANWFTHYSLN